MGGRQELDTAFAMVTDRAARIMGHIDWDLTVGSPASLITVPVTTPAEAVIVMARPTFRMRNGTQL
jgi:cytosine/adenosine deaminase-related metal-dependent hydrolase